MAIASLFLGVLGILAVLADLQDAARFAGEFRPRAEASFFYSPAIALGILMGHLALQRIRADGTRLSGRAMARTGLILGYTALIAGIAVLYVPERIQESRKQKENPARLFLERLNWTARKFHEAYPDRGYPRNLEELGLYFDKLDTFGLLYTPFSATHQFGTSTGYTFTYTPLNAEGGLVAGYHAAALPPMGSRLHKLSSDGSGKIREEEQH